MRQFKNNFENDGFNFYTDNEEVFVIENSNGETYRMYNNLDIMENINLDGLKEYIDDRTSKFYSGGF